MLIKVTNWESQRIIDILRCREVAPSQFAWADDLANKIEGALERNKGIRKEEKWKKQ